MPARNASPPLPEPGTAAWRRELASAQRLRTQGECERYAALCAVVTGREKGDCFQALVDSLVKAEDHGVYEATHNAFWRFPAARLGPLWARALPGLLARMERHEQVERFLCPYCGWARESHGPAFVRAVKALEPALQRRVVRALRKWAGQVPEWEPLVVAIAGPVRKPRSLPEFVVPEAWPAPWKRLIRGNLLVWDRSRPAVAADLVLAVLLLPPSTLDLKANLLVVPLFTYAARHRPAFVARLRALSDADRERVRDSLARIAKTPEGRGHKVAQALLAEAFAPPAPR